MANTEEWQSECKSLRDRGAALMVRREWCDCTLLVGAKRVPERAHRLLLAMASPVFATMFYGAMPERDQPIAVTDVQPDAFRVLLEYVYKDKAIMGSCTVACGVYYAAHKYVIPALQDIASNYLVQNVAAGDACSVYEFAQLVEDTPLKEKCLQILRENIEQVLEDESFKDASVATVAAIFADDQLRIGSEMQLFTAAAKRVQKQEDAEKLRDALKYIRFLTLAPKEFSECPTLSVLLTDFEIMALLMNISSEDSVVPMPSGFSTNRQTRSQSSSVKTRGLARSFPRNMNTSRMSGYENYMRLSLTFPISYIGQTTEVYSSSFSMNGVVFKLKGRRYGANRCAELSLTREVTSQTTAANTVNLCWNQVDQPITSKLELFFTFRNSRIGCNEWFSIGTINTSNTGTRTIYLDMHMTVKF